jgi:hypothetical protein
MNELREKGLAAERKADQNSVYSVSSAKPLRRIFRFAENVAGGNPGTPYSILCRILVFRKAGKSVSKKWQAWNDKNKILKML